MLTKIFADLGILQTRFAGLLLGTAVLQDILLWGVLSIAVAIAHATLSAQGGSLAGTITSHVAINTAFVLAALTVAPWSCAASPAPDGTASPSSSPSPGPSPCSSATWRWPRPWK